MSCRVLGRFLESWIISQVIEILKKKGYKYLLAEFIPSEKNKVAEKFLEANNFMLCEEDSEFVRQMDQYSKKIYGTGGQAKVYLANLNTIEIPNIDIYK